jgi:hypothetical protein
MNNTESRLINAIQVFISGQQRGTIAAKEIEGGILELNDELSDDDSTFDNLIDLLSMFGVGDSIESDETSLNK